MNRTTKTFRNLRIWQKADQIFEMVCEDIKKWPTSVVVKGISYQLLDAVGSISANIAEGYGRGGPKEFEQFLRYCRGSIAETDNWLHQANKQGLFANGRIVEYEKLLEDLYHMTASFIQELRSQKGRSPLAR